MTAQTAVRLFITDPPATAADPVPAKPGVFQIAGTRFCRECGCTDFDACVHAEHGACLAASSAMVVVVLSAILIKSPDAAAAIRRMNEQLFDRVREARRRHGDDPGCRG